MIQILLHGCNGRMGQMISQIVKEDTSMRIAAGVDSYHGIDNMYPVYNSCAEVHEPIDVIIDFSQAGAMSALLEFCRTKQLPVVVCTTGLTEQQLQEIQELSKQVAVLKSANMSLGVNMLLKLVQDAAKTLAPAGFDIEIVEKHHNQKLDAPSGTALAIADSINEVMDQPYQYIYDRSQVREKRGQHEIGISAVRGGTIVGEHDVIYAGLDEVFEIRHTAYSRSIFAKGAIEAARFLSFADSGLYDMSDVI